MATYRDVNDLDQLYTTDFLEDRWAAAQAAMREHVAAIRDLAYDEWHDRDYHPEPEPCPMFADLDQALDTIRSVIERWPHDCDCDYPSGFYDHEDTGRVVRFQGDD